MRSNWHEHPWENPSPSLRPRAINTILLGLVIFPRVLMSVRSLFQWSNLYIVIHCMWLVIRCMWLVIRCMWSVIHCMWSVIHCMWLVIHCMWSVIHCMWLVIHCMWLVIHCTLCMVSHRLHVVRWSWFCDTNRLYCSHSCRGKCKFMQVSVQSGTYQLTLIASSIWKTVRVHTVHWAHACPDIGEKLIMFLFHSLTTWIKQQQ